MKTKYQECKCKTEDDFDHYKCIWRENHEAGKHPQALRLWWCNLCMSEEIALYLHGKIK